MKLEMALGFGLAPAGAPYQRHGHTRARAPREWEHQLAHGHAPKQAATQPI